MKKTCFLGPIAPGVAITVAVLGLLLAVSLAHAADVKPSWQATWQQTVGAAKKEGRLNFYVGRHRYTDPEQRHIFVYIANPSSSGFYYNTTQVTPREFKSYWDLVAPK